MLEQRPTSIKEQRDREEGQLDALGAILVHASASVAVLPCRCELTNSGLMMCRRCIFLRHGATLPPKYSATLPPKKDTP